MYTLFWEIGSGSIVVQALLEEMDVDYTRTYVDMETDEHLGEAYLRHNPAGMVPALRLPDGQTIGETAAILLHLGDRFADRGLIPAADDAQRPAFLFWLSYMATTGYKAFGRLAHPERYVRGQHDYEPVCRAAEEDLLRFFDVIEKAVAGRPYMLPCGFTALDVYLAMLVGWYPDRDALFSRNPRVARLVEAVESRPAYRKTIEEHSPPPMTSAQSRVSRSAR
jgi:glutathione S-transferase